MLSRGFLLCLNGLIILLVVASLLGLIPTSTDQSLAARALPAAAPCFTVAFLVLGRSNRWLAAIALIANLLVLLIGLLFLGLVAFRSEALEFTPASVALLLGFAALCVFVPLISALAVASRWPSRADIRRSGRR